MRLLTKLIDSVGIGEARKELRGSLNGYFYVYLGGELILRTELINEAVETYNNIV
jgi:hypothetical protein